MYKKILCNIVQLRNISQLRNNGQLRNMMSIFPCCVIQKGFPFVDFSTIAQSKRVFLLHKGLSFHWFPNIAQS